MTGVQTCALPISRGRIERLIKNDVLLPLDFSDADKCVDCIKGKYAKTIKKGAVRSTRVLELIHTDICGPLNVKSIDDFDSFIRFTVPDTAIFTLYVIIQNIWTSLKCSKPKLRTN